MNSLESNFLKLSMKNRCANSVSFFLITTIFSNVAAKKLKHFGGKKLWFLNLARQLESSNKWSAMAASIMVSWPVTLNPEKCNNPHIISLCTSFPFRLSFKEKNPSNFWSGFRAASRFSLISVSTWGKVTPSLIFYMNSLDLNINAAYTTYMSMLVIWHWIYSERTFDPWQGPPTYDLLNVCSKPNSLDSTGAIGYRALWQRILLSNRGINTDQLSRVIVASFFTTSKKAFNKLNMM